ncbi:MAG TPA: hypothetical protein VHQ47_16175 [Phycisphaerae bacterium]|nr:hypothetical protein [Phycisphaerae bacterium]
MAATGRMDAGGAVLDAYFLEVRGKLLEIAAVLDRVERAGGAAGDARLAFVEGALGILREGGADRAERVLRLYSKE